MKNCVKICIILFKNWKLLFEMVYQTRFPSDSILSFKPD